MGLLSKIFKPIGKVFKVVFKPIGKLLKKWLTPKTEQPIKDGFEVQKFGANNAIPIVYGPGYVAGTIVDMNVSDSPGGILNENLHILVVFCVGPVDVVELFLDGLPINNPRFSGKVESVIKKGLPGQTPITEAAAYFQRFDTTNSNFPGLVYAYIKLIQDNDQSTFNGVPEISAWVSGRKVSNLPGRTDPFWWTNPAVCLYDYLTDPIWGCGLSSSDIDLSSFNHVADECDELVPVTYRSFVCSITDNVYSCTESPDTISGNKPRHTISTVIDTSRPLFDNMTQISNVFRGFWPDSNGNVKIGIEQEGSAVFTFSESNVLRGTMTMSQPDVSERYNRVTVRYQDTREVTKPFAREVSYPPPGDAQYAEWLAEDNGVPHEMTIDADGIGNPWEALQLAIVAARTSRANQQFEFDAQPEATECDVGDIVSLTWSDYGFTNKSIRISDITYNTDGTVRIQAIQHENAVYPWTNLDFDDINGGSYLGDPDNPNAPTDLTLTPDPTFASLGMLRWQHEQNRFVRQFEVVISRGDPLIETLRTTTPAREFRVDLFPITGPTPVEFRVYGISTTGVKSAAAVLGAVVDYPAAPTSLGLKPSNFEITAAPTTGATLEPLGTTFDIELIGTSLAFEAVRNATFTGLRSATTYSIRGRTVNAFGKSGWTTQSATTTADAGPILELLGDDLIDSIADIVLPPLLDKVDELADTYDTRELIPAGVADAFEDLDLSKQIVNERTVRRSETQTLAAEYTQIRADFDTAQGQNVAQFSQLTIAIATETDARVAQYTLLEADVQANAASIGTTQEAVADLDSALATQVTRIDANSGDISALVLSVGQAETDIAGNASAISGIRTAVAGTDSQSQAELILSATVSNASEAVARAYLGVTSVTGGVARINGIIIDGGTNRIEFRADNVLFTDTAGNPSIYFDTANSRFIFKGDILASNVIGSTLATAEGSGSRTVISPAYPFWSGSGSIGGSGTVAQITDDGFVINQGGITSFSSSSKVRVKYDGVTAIWFGAVGSPYSVSAALFCVDASGGVKCTDLNALSMLIDGAGQIYADTSGDGLLVNNSDPIGKGVRAIGGTFDFYASGTGTYGPFTGSHEALVRKDHPTQPGQLIRDVELISSNGMSNTITLVEVCNSPACKSVVGSVVGRHPVDHDNLPAALTGFSGPLDDYDIVVFNAVGEGLLLACGDLEPGDLLTSGAEPGVAVKQADDIVRSSTVAKCRQHLAAADGVKLVAVIYLAG